MQQAGRTLILRHTNVNCCAWRRIFGGQSPSKPFVPPRPGTPAFGTPRPVALDGTNKLPSNNISKIFRVTPQSAAQHRFASCLIDQRGWTEPRNRTIQLITGASILPVENRLNWTWAGASSWTRRWPGIADCRSARTADRWAAPLCRNSVTDAVRLDRLERYNDTACPSGNARAGALARPQRH